MSAMVENRSARWATISALSADAAAPAGETALLAARARLVAGAAALQARIAERRDEERRSAARQRAALGAAAALASLVCAAGALGTAIAPDLVAPLASWMASGAAILFGLVPAVLLGAAAVGLPRPEAMPPNAPAMLASLATGFGRTIATLDAAGLPEVARTVGALLDVLETEAGTAAQAQRPQAPAAPARRHQRIVPIERRVVVTTVDGRHLIGTIADVSLSGVALTASLPRVAVGQPARVGSRPAVVARLWERGIAFQFDRELDPASFDEAIVL